MSANSSYLTGEPEDIPGQFTIKAKSVVKIEAEDPNHLAGQIVEILLRTPASLNLGRPSDLMTRGKRGSGLPPAIRLSSLPNRERPQDCKSQGSLQPWSPGGAHRMRTDDEARDLRGDVSARGEGDGRAPRWRCGERGVHRASTQRVLLSTKNDTAKAIDYLLNRWAAFTRFLNDGRVCLSNNAAEMQRCGGPEGPKAKCIRRGSPASTPQLCMSIHHAAAAPVSAPSKQTECAEARSKERESPGKGVTYSPSGRLILIE